jgi:hypothetical protein
MSIYSLIIFAVGTLMAVLACVAPPPLAGFALAAFLVALLAFVVSLLAGGLRRPVV